MSRVAPPAGVDEAVWASLPADLQEELAEQADQLGAGDRQSAQRQEAGEGDVQVAPRPQQEERHAHLGVHNKGADCPICFCPVDKGKGIALGACGHGLCEECVGRYLDSEMEEGKVALVCPVVECRKLLMDADILAILGQDKFEKLQVRQLQRSVETDPSLHMCPSPDCVYAVCWSGPEDGEPRIRCPRCHKEHCLVCGASPFHVSVSCEEHREISLAAADPSSRELQELATMRFIKSSRIRICKKCGSGVLKSGGCDKMKCRCGYLFCYACGAENAHCRCTPALHGFWDNVAHRADFESGRDVVARPDAHGGLPPLLRPHRPPHAVRLGHPRFPPPPALHQASSQPPRPMAFPRPVFPPPLSPSPALPRPFSSRPHPPWPLFGQHAPPPPPPSALHQRNTMSALSDTHTGTTPP